MPRQCSSSQAVHLRLGLAASTFSFARARYLPHSMACSNALPSAFMIALYAVMICPTNERALSVDLASPFCAIRAAGGCSRCQTAPRSLRGHFTGAADNSRRHVRLQGARLVANRFADAHETRPCSGDAKSLKSAFTEAQQLRRLGLRIEPL